MCRNRSRKGGSGWVLLGLVLGQARAGAIDISVQHSLVGQGGGGGGFGGVK